ncbi:MAG: hypothetical protein IPG07_07180 [Crocinitomicaceae bacterium]|nr:hypothetical protein [Crocinitomicaceae bacterium]
MNKLKITLSVLIGVTAMTACKKGDEDPFFSLASRKSRISGDWKMTSIESNYQYSDNSGYEYSGSISATETSIVENRTGFLYWHTNTAAVTEYSFTINRDGTWSSTKDLTTNFVRDYGSETSTTPGHSVTTQSGTWAFVYKTKGEYKNKERVNFYVSSTVGMSDSSTTTTVYDNPSYPPTTEFNGASTYKETYAGGENFFTYDLLMLKSKEMKWIMVESGNTANNYSDYVGPYSDSSEFTSNYEITWTAK